jgi:hypothetical protein
MQGGSVDGFGTKVSTLTLPETLPERGFGSDLGGASNREEHVLIDVSQGVKV